MLFAGIDVGSTTSKYVILRDGEITGSSLVDMGIGTAGPERAYCGEHTEEILAALGYTEEQVKAMIEAGAAAHPVPRRR